MNETPRRDLEVFTEALRLPESDRDLFLAGACQGDDAMRDRVSALLQTHGRLGQFLEEAAVTARRDDPSLLTSADTPVRIGRYVLLRPLGEGGCGVVYLAEQEEPVRRQVALKVIKPGMDTKSVIARFEAERQALALMDHPNIAKVFDAGSTESGRPYFVMEWVRGLRITEYCDQNSLTVEARLRLLIQVCHAVQHAHQKGIIHRDIKPSNVLVTTDAGGNPVPVVIDFGIAKATANVLLTDTTVFTSFEWLVGTPDYMSPEQAALGGVDVDTRTDIYSLGVLTYELLTGSTPFNTADVLKSGVDEVRRVIREVEPERPSARLARLPGEQRSRIARLRQLDAARLIRVMSGDLDWIAIKAMEKDRTRRYATANGLALDLRRFLTDETVAARPPSGLYRFRKLVRRNRLLFAGLGILGVCLVVSLVLVAAALSKEHQARREADESLARAKAEQRKAETEAERSRQTTRFLEDMLHGVGPSVARGEDTTMLRGILDRTAERVGQEMKGQPEIEAQLLGLVGRLYLEIGNYERAEQVHQAELRLRRQHAVGGDLAVADALNDLGNAQWKRRKLADAEASFGEALERRRRVLGNHHPEVAVTLNSLGAVHRRQRRLESAEALTREGLAIRQRAYGDTNLAVADSLRNLAIILTDVGRREEAESAARRMLALRRQLLGNDDPQVAAALADLAWVVGSSGSSWESKELETEAFEIRRKFLGDQHPDVAKSIYSFGEGMRRQGNLIESHAVLQAALSIQTRLLGPDHPDTLATLRGLGETLEMEGKLAEAERAYRAALQRWRNQEQEDPPQIVEETRSLARVLVAQRQFGHAEEVLTEVLTPARMGQAAAANLLVLRAQLRARAGRYEEAEADALRALDLDPRNDDRYLLPAVLLARNGKTQGYAELCRRIAATFPAPGEIFTADRLAKACLLLPVADVAVPYAGPLTDRMMEMPGGDDYSRPFFQICKALGEYRRGQFADSADWARRALASPAAGAHAQASGILAMALFHLGDLNGAREALKQAETLAPVRLPQKIADDPGDGWFVWLIARVTVGEARALIP